MSDEKPIEKIATRKAFGQALAELSGKYKNIVVLDSDVGSSLFTNIFAQNFPERHFNFGIAESNMVGAACGFAIRGKIPFAGSFAVFSAGRAWEQLRTSVGYGNFNVKVVGSHGGLSVGEDGATHQAFEDIAITRVIPNFKVFCPADGAETKAMMKVIVEDYGPTYLRFSRPAMPIIYDDTYKFQIGKGSVVKDGNDIAIFAVGTMVHFALEAAKKLAAEGLSVAVINMCSIKPIDEDLIVSYAKKCKMLFSAEDHNILGGLGGAISEVLCEKYPKVLHKIGIEDRFGESGKWEELYKKYGLDADGIVKKVLAKYRT
ncbi:MAG: transketolase central region, transketolase [Candidatus Peregrinibacteria bacterium GW2011_GWC2_39_14]|nr:MAG: hypothetical protein US92_C0006G0017 [Candidatus Peregrinibacteria bacterium GW2011_GWA2_38_36]KKR05874.1 MAG: transketolase central region, transketolase [Candidatus Peregrinibacteria bacterium GW2011_GWC2_39_14]